MLAESDEMGPRMTVPEIIDDERRDHYCFTSSAWGGRDYCGQCNELWPCRTTIFMDRIAALEAENEQLRGWQNGQTHYVGCWREHRSCALATIDFEGARRERAELALREAVEELNRLRDGGNHERR